MSTHCNRYPGCGCSKEIGTKCHLPADHPLLSTDPIAIKITQQLWNCRKDMKIILGDQYAENSTVYKQLIEACQKAHNLPPLQAMLKLLKEDSRSDNTGAKMMFMAATLDIIEAS